MEKTPVTPRNRMISALLVVATAISAAAAPAQGQYRTAAKVEAMLNKSVAAVQADKTKAFANQG